MRLQPGDRQTPRVKCNMTSQNDSTILLFAAASFVCCREVCQYLNICLLMNRLGIILPKETLLLSYRKNVLRSKSFLSGDGWWSDCSHQLYFFSHQLSYNICISSTQKLAKVSPHFCENRKLVFWLPITFSLFKF